METKYILGKYSEYYEAIRKLSEFPLGVTPSIRELNLSRAVTVSIYRSLEKLEGEHEEMGIIEYLGLISFEYLRHMAKPSGKTILEFMEEDMREYPHELRATLRLLHEHPRYLFQKTDRQSYQRVCGLWFDLCYQQIGENSVD